MYQKMLNFLRGSVLAAVECAMPERVFNLCAAHDIPFWDVTWRDPSHFALRTTRWGYVRLRAVTADIDADITRLREKGAPVVLRRFRRRYVLLGAAAVFVFFVWLGNTFVWDFAVTGNDTVPTEKILRALEKQGVTVGTPARAIHQEELRNHLLLELKDISWLAVNVSGCTAHVQVVERHRPPELMTDNDATNVVADRPGLITKVEALDGRACVLPGDTVEKGQLLISGVVDGAETPVRLLHGMGRVYARTWYELTAAVPLTCDAHTETGRSWTSFSLLVGKTRIKFAPKGSVLGADCDKITTYMPITMPFGFRLPVTLVRETRVAYGTLDSDRTVQEARQEAESALLRQLQGQLTQGAEIRSTRFSAAEQQGYLVVTLSAECQEQIGVSVPIP